jgi:hypothetical protein
MSISDTCCVFGGECSIMATEHKEFTHRDITVETIHLCETGSSKNKLRSERYKLPLHYL